MALAPGAALLAPVAAMINHHALRLGRAEKKMHQSSCTNCGVANVPVFQCTKCHSVQYCGKECQVTHWKGGHKEACKKLRSEKQEVIVLEKPALITRVPSTFSVYASEIQPFAMASDIFASQAAYLTTSNFISKYRPRGLLYRFTSTTKHRNLRLLSIRVHLALKSCTPRSMLIQLRVDTKLT